jgi:outer membrane lipoprotein-sorting protein
MKKILSFVILVLTSTQVLANSKNNIIENLKSIENISFNFEQNINGKIEDGECVIHYPKKIYCKYNLPNEKILVSNGKSLVIKTLSSYYLYPLDKTPLNFILDKNFLIKKIDKIEERIVDDKFINFNFTENESEINLFFDRRNYNLVGWQTRDLYQNLSITYLSSINFNKKLNKNLFEIPERN